MKRLLLAAALLAASISQAGAVWWLENDYSFGSNGLKKNSLTVFRKTSRAFTSGLNVSFYRDSASYRERVYSARLPLMYSGPAYFISLKPFLYPVAPSTRSGAYGGKLYGLVSIDEGQDESFTHLVFSGAWARQKAYFGDTAAPERKEFSQYAFELQAEKSFYGQFFFLASAAGFSTPGNGASNANLVTPVLDQAELAYLGTFRHTTAIPEWVLAAQVARNMRPEYDSHLYAGYSKISFRDADRANSLVGGLKLNLNEKSTLDLAYNAYKAEGTGWKSYYKLLLQLFF
ncbi:MAG: hypothetical protein CVU79_06300 [Elusimicrobia bacterium HGW-Elusimicrobia-3]|nr:MAG: hypothetical protein CVU79_06300 [Elusimicrobia bacterium HGW-Elusimicrobia-3]